MFWGNTQKNGGTVFLLTHGPWPAATQFLCLFEVDHEEERQEASTILLESIHWPDHKNRETDVWPVIWIQRMAGMLPECPPFFLSSLTSPTTRAGAHPRCCGLVTLWPCTRAYASPRVGHKGEEREIEFFFFFSMSLPANGSTLLGKDKKEKERIFDRTQFLC